MKMKNFTEVGQHMQVFFHSEDRRSEPYNGKRHTLWDLKGKKQGVLPKGLCVFCTLQPPKISLSCEARSSSHNSQNHEEKLPDITFVPLRASSPQSPAVTAVVIFLHPWGAQPSHCQPELTLPIMGSSVSPTAGFWGQVPTTSSSKIEKNSFILKPQFLVCPHYTTR